MWPDGYRASPLPEVDFEGDKICRAALARAKLIGSVPGTSALFLSVRVYTCGLSGACRGSEKTDRDRYYHSRNCQVVTRPAVEGCCVTGHGIPLCRLFQMFQSEAVNRRLALVVMEGLLDTMLPQRNLKEAFRSLRTRISKLY